MTHQAQDFDRRAREAHRAAVEALSPRVQAQLRLRTRQALSGTPAAGTPRAPRWGWIAAPALALALALAFALPWPGSRDTPDPADTPLAATTPAATTPEVDVAAPLEQDPDFYLWLASADAIALAGDRP